MRSSNLTRLRNIEFKRGTGELLQANAEMVEGQWKVVGLGNDELTGIYNEFEYKALVARKDVMVVFCSVREKIA